MSRTRKTRPFNVRLADKTDKGVGIKEVHNHIDRECDLPETLTPNVVPEVYEILNGQIPCHYSYKYTGKGFCGCPMCTNQLGRKLDIKKTRLFNKKQARLAKTNGIFDGEE